MILVEKNEGTKIPYEVDGYKVCFDDDLTINLAKRQEDWAVKIDICSDPDGALVIGTGAGRYYVAQIDIPATTYTTSTDETTDENGETVITVTQTANDLDMGDVTLTLWKLENYVTNEN